ncbi:hypothetical protein VP395_12700 [Mariniflexile soesokkakense]|uniref:PH (Pleckstrin Homology) domain-containing protein n=1 Tax=Mariniflexile soesokkakense TaxID=1343160 RepID=A0ABV0ABW9_9FLAO
MKLLKAFDKILAGFGNIRAMERTHIDTYTEGLISKIEGELIAESEYGKLFVSFQNLADYEFLNITVLSGSNIKTFDGSTLVFINGNDKITYFSDTKEIESDYSNVSKRWLTKISFVINDDDKKMVLERKFEKIFLNYKKKSIPMNKYD